MKINIASLALSLVVLSQAPALLAQGVPGLCVFGDYGIEFNNDTDAVISDVHVEDPEGKLLTSLKTVRPKSSVGFCVINTYTTYALWQSPKNSPKLVDKISNDTLADLEPGENLIVEATSDDFQEESSSKIKISR